MRRSLSDLFVLLNRWPRRLAALSCLLLAGAAALAARDPAAARPGGDTAAVVVSARSLAAGSTLAARDLKVVRWPRNVLPTNRVEVPGMLVGRRLSGAIAPGEAITTTRLVGTDLAAGLPPGFVAGTLTIADDVSGLVHAGGHVDVLAGSSDETAPDSSSAFAPITSGVVAQDVTVLAALPPSQSNGDSQTTRLIVAVDRRTAVRLATLQGRQPLAVVADPP